MLHPAPLALLVGACFGWIAWRLRLLTASGAVAGGLLAATVLAFGSVYHVATGAGFFVLSSLISRLPGGRAAAARAEKGSTRDALQVLANGGVAWACLLLAPSMPWLWGGALAAAAADTWATEIGTRYGGTPRLATTLRRVPAGTSGAVSLIGTLAAVAGALSVPVLGEIGQIVAALRHQSVGFFYPILFAPIVAVAAGGVAGALADTILGATLQARYRSPEGVVTEKRHAADGTPHAPAGGLAWIDNDAVNALATLVGALVAAVAVALTGWVQWGPGG